MQKLTLEKIGELAGVSRATVSRVINNYPHISESVRSRVQQVIDETGYTPNEAARSLASNQSNIIGLVIPNVISAVFSDPYYLRLIQGISAVCNQQEYTLALFLFHTVEEERTALQRFTRNSLVDGLIVTADNVQNPFVPQLLKRDIPLVYVGRPEDPEHVTFVDVDNVNGAYLVTQHLIERGYRRIATLATAHNTAGHDRLLGYRRALAEAGLPVDESLVQYGVFNEQSGYEGMQVLLDKQPDAVFAQSDLLAVGATRVIRENGLRVPDDIAVAGFDDLPMAEQHNPPLTTVRQHITETGRIATHTLIDALRNPDQTPHQVILPTELIVRDSTRAVI